MVSNHGLAARVIPVIPTEFQIYNSYTVDPQWQIKFTIIWTSVLAFTTLASIPFLIRSARSGRLFSGLLIRETMETKTLTRQNTTPALSSSPSIMHLSRFRRVMAATYAIWQSFSLWTLPLPNITVWKSQVADCCRRSYFSLGVAQLSLIGAYIATVISCFVVGANLVQNSNRPGFIAIAQLPVIVLLSLKSPLPVPIFLPTLSYEHYNFMHRWAGRTMWLCTTVHGSMWLNQFISYDEYDQVWADKTKRGMIAYALMCLVVITSLKPVRRKCYQLFWLAHVTCFVGFFAALSYHTPYSRPWIYPCVALYAYDHVVRLLRYRLKDAIIIPVDSTLTMIHIPDCDAGWLPAQHVNIRVLRGVGIFESHPFTVTNASASALTASPRGIILYAKVAGDWTRRLHDMAKDLTLEIGDDFGEREAFIKAENEGGTSLGAEHPGRKVTVMIDGPYGGLKMDLGRYESVLLIAGGSGITFVLGSIEEALSRCEKGKGPRKVDVAWVCRDLCTIEALTPTLCYLHAVASRLSLDLTYNLYLTNPPFPLPTRPAALPVTTTLSPYRPEVAQLVREALPVSLETDAGESTGGAAPHDTQGGGLAVIAAGPEGLVMEARNAVAGMTVNARVRAGGIGFHAEVYAL